MIEKEEIGYVVYGFVEIEGSKEKIFVENHNIIHH